MPPRFIGCENYRAIEALKQPPEPRENPLSYEEVERIGQRIYQFGRDNNPVSRDCEFQALRIRLGWTGAGACIAPTKFGPLPGPSLNGSGP